MFIGDDERGGAGGTDGNVKYDAQNTKILFSRKTIFIFTLMSAQNIRDIREEKSASVRTKCLDLGDLAKPKPYIGPEK